MAELIGYVQGPWFDMAEGDYPFASTYITYSVGPGTRRVSRSVSPKQGSIQFRALIGTYDAPPWGPSVRVGGLAKSRKTPF